MNIDWSEWGPPLAVVAGGLGIGAAILFRARRRADPTIALEGQKQDLAQNRESMVEQLKALELERDKLEPELYRRERDALLARGAAALRGLEEGIAAPESTGDAVDDAIRRLHAERERLGPAAFSAAVRAVAPDLVPGVRPAISPEWKGAGWAFGLCALVALLYGAAGQNSADRAQGAPITGGGPMGGAAPQQSPEWEEARKQQEAVLDANPNDVEALNNLTQMWLSAGDAAKAMDYNKRSLAAQPGNHDGRVFKAVLAASVGMDDKALTELDAVLAEEPTHVRALVYRGLILMDMGRPDEAVASLESAVKAQPGSPELMRLLGKAKQMASGGAPPMGGPPMGGPPAAPAGPAETLVSGTIELDPARAAALTGSETLFVSVKSSSSPIPLAALKLPAGPFPLKFEVTTANLIPMARGQPISDTLVLKVKIDVDGNPITDDAGQPIAELPSVAKGTTGLEVGLK